MELSTRRARQTLATAVAALLIAAALTACGSDRATGGPAAARENAAALFASAATCTDPSSGAPVTCAVSTRGPGGGIVFYDAGSQQAWGRFLEVAPQNWNGTPSACPKSIWLQSTCGFVSPAVDGTSDAGPGYDGTTTTPGLGYLICSKSSSFTSATSTENFKPLAGYAGTTGTAVGAGRNNTAVLLAATDCTVPADPSSVTLAAGYRGGGLNDWYLAAKDELLELCRYTHRNSIGGFVENHMAYASSTAYPGLDAWYSQPITYFTTVQFDDNCTMGSWDGYSRSAGNYAPGFVRPIRAF